MGVTSSTNIQQELDSYKEQIRTAGEQEGSAPAPCLNSYPTPDPSP